MDLDHAGTARIAGRSSDSQATYWPSLPGTDRSQCS